MNKAFRIVSFKCGGSSDKVFRIVIFIVGIVKIIYSVKAEKFRIGAFVYRYYISFIILCGSVIHIQVFCFKLFYSAGRVHKKRINFLVVAVNIVSAEHNAGVVLFCDSIEIIAYSAVVDVQFNTLGTVCDIFRLDSLIKASEQNCLKCPEYNQAYGGECEKTTA